MKKTLAIILNLLILFSLSTGLSFCFCAENAECKSTYKVNFETKENNDNISLSNTQISAKDCCSDCYKHSDAEVLNGARNETNPFEDPILFFNESCFEKLACHSELFDSKRGPPKNVSLICDAVFFKTQRILI